MVGEKKDPNLCEFGNTVLLKLLRAFSRQLHGVRHADDPEYIHQMRVASRRLRAAMPIFQDCFPRKEYKQWLREIRRVTRALGEARDLDVQILFLEKYREYADSPPHTNEGRNDAGNLPQVPSIEPGTHPDGEENGIEYISRILKTRRDILQPGVTDALDSLEESGTIASMEQAFRERIKKQRRNPPKGMGKGIYRFAASGIGTGLDTLMSYEKPLRQPDAISEHHAMRIAAKRLRYRMEIFRPLYGKELTRAITVMKRLQTLLGELHDCDVWIDMLPGLLSHGHSGDQEQQRAAPKTDARIQAFIEDQKKYRLLLYHQVVRYWERLTRDEFFPKLREILKAGAVTDPPGRRGITRKS